MAVEYILKNSLLRRTLDNVTVVLIAFSNFKRAAFGSSKNSITTSRDINKKEIPPKSSSTNVSQATNVNSDNPKPQSTVLYEKKSQA